MRVVLAFVALLCATCSSEPEEPAARKAPTRPVAVASRAAFERIPSPVPDVAHGRLLKYFRIRSPFAGALTYRIMYASRSVSGRPIVVTGLAVVPTGDAPARSRVVLSTAHGTTGLADECAPSRRSNLGEVALLGTGASTNGWVLAATDYEGLGTPGRHPYLVGVSEGRAVLDAARAATQLPDARAGDKLLLAGYSQGGHAAAWANELAPRWTPDFDVLGAFVGAPASEIDQILAAGRTRSIQGYLVAIVAGYAAAYSDAQPSRYLTDAGVSLLDQTDKGCFGHVDDMAGLLSPTGLVRASGPTDAQWQELGRRNNPGSRKGGGPVLIVHSQGDEVVPVEVSERLRDRMCKNGQIVERRVVRAGGHGPAALASYIIAAQWLQDRVRGVAPVDECDAA